MLSPKALSLGHFLPLVVKKKESTNSFFVGSFLDDSLFTIDSPNFSTEEGAKEYLKKISLDKKNEIKNSGITINTYEMYDSNCLGIFRLNEKIHESIIIESEEPVYGSFLIKLSIGFGHINFDNNHFEEVDIVFNGDITKFVTLARKPFLPKDIDATTDLLNDDYLSLKLQNFEFDYFSLIDEFDENLLEKIYIRCKKIDEEMLSVNVPLRKLVNANKNIEFLSFDDNCAYNWAGPYTYGTAKGCYLKVIKREPRRNIFLDKDFVLGFFSYYDIPNFKKKSLQYILNDFNFPSEIKEREKLFNSFDVDIQNKIMENIFRKLSNFYKENTPYLILLYGNDDYSLLKPVGTENELSEILNKLRLLQPLNFFDLKKIGFYAS